MIRKALKKYFTKLPKMKNAQSDLKPIKIGKQPGTRYCFGCKDYTKSFRPEKYLEKNLIVLFVDLINQDF